MTEYWKSQAKKFCDFCKCWISDNKPSISFHEAGKRHKENVAKRLSEISKNSAKSHREELQVDKEMKKMEEEAFKAYMKDLKENPDFTSQRILEETERRKKELEELVRQQKEGNEEPESGKLEEPHTEGESLTTKLWYEAKSDENYTYYWNINTAESRWEPPEEGFLSLEEQKKQQQEAKIKEEVKRNKKEEKAKQKQEEIKGLKEKKTMKKKRKKDEDEEVTSLAVGPVPKPDPYGAWTVIEPVVEKPLDLELPQQEYVVVKVPDVVEPQIKFKEKTVASLQEEELDFGAVKKEADESCGSFKKRKVNRGNMRQKLDTD